MLWLTKFARSDADLGTRAGLHSQTLISTGLADLDRILGGGLPLGTILVLLDDSYSLHGSTLLRYFAAEGVVCGHRVLWAGATMPEPKSLPSLAKSRSHSQVRTAQTMKSLSLQATCRENTIESSNVSVMLAAGRPGARQSGGPEIANSMAIPALHKEAT